MNRSSRRRIALAVCGMIVMMMPFAHAGFPDTPASCTAFLICDGRTVLGGGNEDQGAFPARAWFVPAEEDRHGRVLFGFEGVVQSGMNDQGLFYDSLSAPDIDVAAEDGKPLHHGMWTLRALEVCSTVDDVVACLDAISVPGTWTDQLFFGDRNGDSIIVEGKTILRPEANFQVCTNFVHSWTAHEDIACDRYLTAERMLGEMDAVTFDAVRDVFAATADTYRDGSGTAYTTIYEPVHLAATIYFWRDYDHPIHFDLASELARGPHVVELVDAAYPNPRRDAWVAGATAELDRLIEARIDRSVNLDEARADLVGHYVVDPTVGVAPSPPVMISAASITWDEEWPQVVVVPEGISFDLRPAGDDVWFHTNVTMMPEMDFAFRRDDGGRLIGGVLTLIGLGDIPFVKTSDAPAFEPLPTRVLSFDPDEAVGPSTSGHTRAPLVWWLAIGAGLLWLGILALAAFD